MPLPPKVTQAVPAGTRIILRTAGGGGYGPAWERDSKKVCRDVLHGLISVERARTCYGVVIDPETHTVDEKATHILRQKGADRADS